MPVNLHTGYNTSTGSPATTASPSINVPQSDKVMATYLNQLAPQRSKQFWEAWMLNEDTSVVGNNPLNIMTGESSVSQYINPNNPQQPNRAFNFASPKQGAIATVTWLQQQGYNNVLTAPTDAQAIQDLAQNHGSGYFAGGNASTAQQYANNIMNDYTGINPSQTSASPSSFPNPYTGLAGIFKSIDNMEKSNLPIINISWFDLGLVILGLAITIIAITSVAAKKAAPILPLVLE